MRELKIVNPQNAIPMIEHTKPAVAIFPTYPSFLALLDKTIPKKPKNSEAMKTLTTIIIISASWTMKIMGRRITIESTPHSKDARALLLSGFAIGNSVFTTHSNKNISPTESGATSTQKKNTPMRESGLFES